MPRDKTETHNRQIPCIRREFLEHGYDKASLKNIAASAGISAAGIYRHFPGKQAMFAALVEPTTSEFLRKCNATLSDTYDKLWNKEFRDSFCAYRMHKNEELINFIYDHYSVFKLLLCCSEGTPYAHFKDQLIEIEIQETKDLFAALDQEGISHNQISDDEFYILASTFITAFCVPVKYDYSREKAIHHMNFLGKLLYPGMKQVLGF